MSSYDLILSRDSYLLAFELRLFWSITFLYGLSFLLFAFHILSRTPVLGKAARTTLILSVIAHTALIVLRTFEGGRAPFQTLYESLSWFAWSASLTFLYVSRKWKDIHIPGVFVTVLAMGACLYALLSRSPAVEPLAPPLQSYWFEWHVILAFFSYAVFVVSASIEATYLGVKPLIGRGAEAYGFSSDMLEDFHSMAFKLVLFGFPLLTFGIFSGAAWANEAWGRYWSWDPKETWSLITWTVFALYLHAKAIPRFKGLPASVINIVGFICMMMTFLGVNWLAKLLGVPSLHIYAV
ncbi:MAG: c-type cytochrome biogenesis protein CcsB [Deltaproteobacteria bacterium]|nr:c-type cytochrome biogenesis protein CcsB [Deltaproteobacteria bacterium]